MNESELWQRFIGGEKDILEVFYKEYYNLLFNYGLKLYSDEELIKDCIQDLFVKLYKSDLLKSTVSVRSYLLKALKNTIHDKLSGKHNNLISLNNEHFNLGIDDQELELLFQKNDTDVLLSKQLLESYQKLPKNQKLAIYLRYIKGLSYKEISDILEINTQSSMNLVSRALSNIRKQILKVFLFFI